MRINISRRSMLRPLVTLPGLPVLPLLGPGTPGYGQELPKEPIATVEMLRVEGRRPVAAAAKSDGQYQAGMNHVYDELRPKVYEERPRAAGEAKATAYYLRIRCQSGLEGLYGPIDSEAAIVVYTQLRPFLIGKDALAGATLWDQMYGSNRHSRAGHFMMAISAVDNALWDLRGRYFKTPVYRLLGGPSRSSVRAYGSCLGYSIQPELAKAKAADLKRDGFLHQKWFIPYGPGSGAEGMAKNVELAKVLRESVGPDVDIMFDAFMGWDLAYAMSWCQQVEQYRPRWIEEAFPPDQLESFAALRKATRIPIASGEHFYGRWETKRYLEAGAVTVVQADPEWCGGVSELTRICQIASVYGAQVIPHGHSLHAALHVVASQDPRTCPLVEFLISKMGSYYFFERDVVKPVNGLVALPTRPGFGITLDTAKIEKQSVATWG